MQAIIVRCSALREHDQLVVLYGRETGRLAAIAKGSLRMESRQAPTLDEGNLISCELVAGRGDLAIMTGAQAQRCWANAKGTPAAWAVAQFFLQATDALVYDGQYDGRFWAVLASILEQLDAGTDPLRVLRHGQAAMLEALGYGRRAIPAAYARHDAMDDEFDRIAQRHLSALDLVYHLAR